MKKGKLLEDRDVSLLAHQLAMLAASGETGAESLRLLAEDAPAGLFRDTAAEASRYMEEELLPLPEALEKTGAVPPYAVSLLQAGSDTGRLQETLEALAGEYERLDALNARLKNALLYPALLLLFMCLILAVLVLAVLPVFEEVYANLAGSLTAASMGYIGVARLIGWAALVLVGLFCAALLVVSALTQRGMTTRSAVLQAFSVVPAVGAAMQGLALSRVSGALYSFCAAGETESEALRRSLPLAENAALEKRLQACLEEVSAGETLARSLYTHRIFDPLSGRLLVSAGRAGRLEEALERLSTSASENAEKKLYALLDMLEPLLTGFLTLSVGAVLLSVMLPLAGILSSIG